MFISRFVKPPEYQKVKREGREYIEELRDPFIPNKTTRTTSENRGYANQISYIPRKITFHFTNVLIAFFNLNYRFSYSFKKYDHD